MSSAWNTYEEQVKTWRSEILQNVNKVPINGTPGTCIVYKNHSAAIVSGSKPQNVCMAAATLGNGRIFAIAHNSYLNNQEFRKKPNVKKLMENVYKWVSKGKHEGDDDVLDLKSKHTDFNKKKILVWSGGQIPGINTDKVREFVENGGGLVHATCPWGWLQLQKPKKHLDEMPIMDILTTAGISYTENYCQKDAHFTVDLSDEANHMKATENISYVLHLVKKQEDLAKYGESLCQGVAGAPRHIKRELTTGIKEMFSCHQSHMQTPSRSKPTKDPAERCLVQLCDQLCDEDGDDDMRSVSCVDDFLGACGEGQSVCSEREFTAKLKDFHSTGLYARPGAEIVVDVLSGPETLKDGWVLRIGSHTDNNTKLAEWKRWPKLCKRFNLTSTQQKTYSPYGGLIYLENPDFKDAHSIKVKIEGAVEAPRFDATAPDARERWLACRDAPGPWADLCGRLISFTMPSSSVRHLDDPGPALDVWDRVVEAHCSLRGTNTSEFRHQWVVCDAQPVAGYMHAGYPIVTMMDVADPKAEKSFLLNPEHVLNNGCWGMFHELGHNMQRPYWTFQGTGEVTCNIFSLHAMEVISNKKPWIHEWLGKQMKKIEKTLQKENPYEDWVKSPGVALGIYAQLQHCFGWDAYKTVFAHYEALDEGKKPKGNENQLKYWVELFSKTVGYNLSPLYEFWGFKLPESVTQGLNLPPFLPDDEMTQLAPNRVEFLTEVYPGLVRQS